MAGSVASADIGMWQVPQDMLTLVHHNELVMPQAEAGAFRSLSHRVGERRFARRACRTFIRPPTSTSRRSTARLSRPVDASNGSAMLKAVDEAVRHGAALGLKRLRG